MHWDRRADKSELWSDFLWNISIMSWTERERGNQRLIFQEYCCGSHLWASQHANEQSSWTSNTFDDDRKYFKLMLAQWRSYGLRPAVWMRKVCSGISRCLQVFFFPLAHSSEQTELMCCITSFVLLCLILTVQSFAGCVCVCVCVCVWGMKRHGETDL